MARLRYNGLTATLGADLLTADTAITFSSALTSAAGAVPTISGSDYIPLAILDTTGKPVEIVHLTAYTAGATTGTVTRAQESTTAADRTSGLSVVNGATVADFVALASQQADLLTPLQEPFYIAHSSSHLFPEHSMESYRAAFESGFLVEVDLHVLSDGTVVPIHDPTLDRTTDGTGNVSAIDRDQWKALRIDPAFPGLRKAVPPTWEEVLNEFGGRVVIVAEIKAAGALQPTIDSILERNLQRSVIIQSFTLSDVEAAAAEGIGAMYLSDSVTDFAGLVSSGIEYLGCSTTTASRATYIADAVAAGLKVAVYTIDEPTTTATVLTEGAAAVFSDDPWYTSGLHPGRDSDALREKFQGWPALGLTDRVLGNEPFTFREPNEYGLVSGQSVTAYSGTIPLDWAGPRPGNVEIEATFQFLGPATNQQRWAGIAFGVWPASSTFRDVSELAGQFAYNCLVRRDGTLDIYKLQATAVTTKVGTATGAAVAAAGAEGTARMRLTISSTGITWKNLTNGVTATSTDTALRAAGSRLALTLNAADVLASDIRIRNL